MGYLGESLNSWEKVLIQFLSNPSSMEYKHNGLLHSKDSFPLVLSVHVLIFLSVRRHDSDYYNSLISMLFTATAHEKKHLVALNNSHYSKIYAMLVDQHG